MIRDLLVPRLLEQFSCRGLRVGLPPEPVATIPAAHPEVGDVRVWDDGGEATVEVGEITHIHFGCYEPGLTELERHQWIAGGLVDLLTRLFDDRVLLWRSPGPRPRSGGSLVLSSKDLPRVDADDLKWIGAADMTYLWSGPTPNPKGGRTG